MKHQLTSVSTRILNYLLILSILLFPLGQLGKLTFGVGGVYLYEIPFTGFVLLGLLFFSRNRLKTKELRYLTTPILIFLAVLLFTYSISLWWYPAESNLSAGLYLLRLMVYFGGMLVIMISTAKQLLWYKAVVQTVYLSTSVLAASALIQYVIFPDLRAYMPQGWDPHAYRAFGTVLEPAVLAGILGISVFFFFWKELPPARPWRMSLLVLLVMIIVLTFSRGAYLSLIIGMLPILRSRKTIIGGILALLLAGAVVWAVPKPDGEGVNLLRTSTIQSRAVDYKEGIEIWQERPITGIGFNHIADEKEVPPSRYPHHAQASFHSSFLMILVTSGVFGLITYLFLLYRLCRVERYMCSLILFLGAFSLFDNMLLHPFILFWSAVTFVAVFAKKQKQNSTQSHE
jgi:O-antigen ligase